jgi:hypothetical protein
MKNKVILFLVSLFIMFGGYLVAEEFSFRFETCGVGYKGVSGIEDDGKFKLTPECEGYKKFLSDIDSYVGEPMFFYSLALIIISLMLFIFSDKIFKKWLKFALGYTIFAWFIIFITPVSSVGFLDPDREQVSIWMSSLFLVISLILLAIWQFKEKKSSK